MVRRTLAVARHIGRAWFAALVLGLVLTAPIATFATFQYTDGAGTVHFTDDPGQIPEPVRKRMGIWVDEPEASPDASQRLRLADRQPSVGPVNAATAAPSLQERVLPATIRSPWVPGLIGLAAAGSLLLGLRASTRPGTRAACKVAIVLVIAVSGAATMVVVLAERGSSVPAVIGEAEATIDRWESRVEAPFKDAERRAKELGKAKRQYQETVRQFESLP
jgi:hypothetical protein